MKTKKLSLTMIFLAITMVAYLVASLVFCYTTKPEITTGEFPFSITYEYKGETGTLSGVLTCEYSGSYTIFGEHYRYWNQEITYDNPDQVEYPFVIDENSEWGMQLEVHENMSAGYFMGDPLHKDYYKDIGLEEVGPYFVYYNHKEGVVLDDENQDEVLKAIDFRIVDATYADPVENSFSFSGIKYEADNILVFEAILLVFFLLCLIFVRRDKEYTYVTLDKVGIALNFLVAFVAVPLIYLMCMFFGLVESGVEIIDQIIYNIPPFTILCLALSVVFRRKGYSKAGFFVQFGGIIPFAMIFYWN